MKVTRRQLRRIINEELNRVLREDDEVLGATRLEPGEACPNRRCNAKLTDVIQKTLYTYYQGSKSWVGSANFFVPAGDTNANRGYMARVTGGGERYDVWQDEDPEGYAQIVSQAYPPLSKL